MHDDSIIKRQGKALSMLFAQLEAANVHLGVAPWYTHVPPARSVPPRIADNALIPKAYQTLKFSDDFLELLSLDNMCELGTWGRFKVVAQDDFSAIVPSDDINIYILHCNIHTEIKRQQTIKTAVDKMRPALTGAGVKDIVVLSTNEHVLPEDIVYARKVHRSCAHWSPYATASIMKKNFAQFPKSFVITSNYIGSLLLDNGLSFTMDFRYHPDVEPSLYLAFEDIIHYIKARMV